jgi:hypothetical protein
MLRTYWVLLRQPYYENSMYCFYQQHCSTTQMRLCMVVWPVWGWLLAARKPALQQVAVCVPCLFGMRHVMDRGLDLLLATVYDCRT